MKVHMNAAPIAVQNAFNAVKSAFPEVTKVTFDNECLWLYSDNAGMAPDFKNLISVDLLEDAADSLEFYPVTFFTK